MSIPSIYDYLPEAADVIMKTATADKTPSAMKQNLVLLGKGLAGLGIGSATGLGLGVAADMLHEKFTGRPIDSKAIKTIAPILGAAAGITYSIFKSKQDEEMKRVIESTSNGHLRGVPSK